MELNINNLSIYGNEQKILDSISLRVREQEVCALMGRGAREKKLLLRVAAKYEQSISEYIEAEDAPHGLQPPLVKLLSTTPFLFLTAHEFLRYHFCLEKGDEQQKAERLARALEVVGLKKYAHTKIKKLSQIHKRLLLVAHALAGGKSILCCDFSDIKASNAGKKSLQLALEGLKKAGCCVLISLAPELCVRAVDQIAVLNGAQLVQKKPYLSYLEDARNDEFLFRSKKNIEALTQKLHSLRAAQQIRQKGKNIVVCSCEKPATLEILSFCSCNNISVKKINKKQPCLKEIIKNMTMSQK